ncbi:diaminopimelate decarboxylase [Myxococcota bacterium]|nr:diaminopimelate decarboxylase [Myxococcota bacterium]
MFHFAYDAGGALFAESCDLARLADEIGTPAYVYARATLERHFRVYDAAFDGHPHLVCYSVKASSSRAILQLFAQLGSGADIVSGGELERALAAGIPAEKIVFSGVGKTRAEMARALEAGIHTFNVESEPELRALAEVAAQMGKVAPVSLRVNPDIDAKTHPYIATGLHDSKFGVPIDEARALAAEVARTPSLELVGIDCHIGSQLVTIEPLVEALDSVLALADELASDGHVLRDIDLGGGLGITYAEESPPHPDVLGRAVVERMRGRNERLILEPGRVIVGNAGILLTRVLYVKRSRGRTFVVVDAAMNDLIRPALYAAHHDIWPVKRRPGAPRITADVVGPVCESGDCFAKDRELDAVEEGDLVAIMSAGAYGFSMSSTYNSRPRAAEVLVDGARHHVIRRRERIEDLVAGESVPEWLREGSSGPTPR